MPDRSEHLRREAARCLEAAEHSTDPKEASEPVVQQQQQVQPLKKE